MLHFHLAESGCVPLPVIGFGFSTTPLLDSGLLLRELFHLWLLLHLAQAQLKVACFVSEQASDSMQAVSGVATDLIHLAAGKEP